MCELIVFLTEINIEWRKLRANASKMLDPIFRHTLYNFHA